MAIYRIKSKIFTRAEKELIKQVWRKTKGLRELSSGVTNLEDAKALKNLSGQLSSDGQVEITPEIRKALDNLGFTKVTEGTINKMKSKSENKAAADRLKRIQDSKFEKVIATGGMPNYLKKTLFKDYRRTAQTVGLQKQVLDKINSLESGCQVDPSLSRFYRKKLNGTVLKADDPGVAYTTSKLGSENLTMGELKEITPEAKRVTKKDLENFNKNGHLICISKDAPRGPVLHEMGHIKSRKEFGGSRARGKGKLLEGIDTIAEENMASANALHTLRNQRGVEKDKEMLDKALSTYTLDLRKKMIR
jgi:hypothetical protein